jgi:hypothetical protein
LFLERVEIGLGDWIAGTLIEKETFLCVKKEAMCKLVKYMVIFGITIDT